MAKALSNFMAMDGLQTGEGDWSTGMALYLPLMGAAREQPTCGQRWLGRGRGHDVLG
jgi:hypothetical protein